MTTPHEREPRFPVRKIIAIYAATTITAILLVGLYHYHHTLQIDISQERRQLGQISYRIKSQLDIFLSQTRKHLELVSSLPEFTSLPHTDRIDISYRGIPENLEGRKRVILNDLLKKTEFSRAFIILPSGDHYLAQPYTVQKKIHREKFNLDDRPYFREIRETNQPVISDSILGADGQLSMVIMTPLLDSDREGVIGYLGGVCHPGDLATILESTNLKEFVRAMVLDRRGKLLAHSEMEVTPANQEKYRDRNMVLEFLARLDENEPNPQSGNPSCICNDYSTEEGEQWLTAICRLDNGWGLVLCKDKDEIISGFLPSIWTTTLFTALLFLLVSAIGLLLVRFTGQRWLTSQKALEESRTRFEELVDLLPVMVCELDLDGHVTYANREALEKMGYAREDLDRNYHILQLFAPEDRERVTKNMDRVYRGGESVAHEYFMMDRKGNRVPVLVYSRTIIRNDTTRGMRGVAIDISRLKETEELLRRSEERFRKLYHNSPIPQQSLDDQGNILEVNQAWLDHLGYEYQEVIGRPFTDFLRPESAENFRDEYPIVKKHGDCGLAEFEMIRKDQSVLLASFAGRGRYDEEGNFLQIHCSFEDITEVRKAELEKSRHRQGLEKLDSWVKELLSAEKDINHFCNLVCQGLLDLMEAETAMMPLIDQTGESFTYVAAAGKGAEYVKDLTLPLDDGTLCGWVAAQGSPVLVADLSQDPRADQEMVKQLNATTGILNPINVGDEIVGGLSAFRQGKPYEQVDEHLLNLFAQRVGALFANHNLLLCLEEMIEERSRELEVTHRQLLQAEKLSAIGSLSASIAHEFNNPLQGIMSIVKGIRRRAALDDKDAELVDMAIGECKRMRDLIIGLQEFNRPTSGKYTMVDVHALIDHILLLSKKDHANRGIMIKTDYDPNLPRVRGVEDQLKQVFLNLIKNAAESCSSSDTITITTAGSENRIFIAVADTGKGIPSEDLERIFEPFFTTKTEQRGIGLGLSVSYGIIKAHNGNILVESQPDQETVFTVILPEEKE